MKLFITLLENVNKSRTSAGNFSLILPSLLLQRTEKTMFSIVTLLFICFILSSDADYKKFLESLKSDAEPTMSVDSYLEELEEKERQRKGKALHKIGTQH
jgi:hypothetical protein